MIKIHSIETFGTHEGPGIRLVLFLQGCNMRCLYCHNPDTQSLQDSAKTYSDEQITKLLRKQKPYFGNKGGLTLSGGEPTLQAKKLLKLVQKVKKEGFNVVLDTNGSLDTSDVRKLLDLSDLVIFDVKHINSAKHQKLTGLDNQNTLNLVKYRENAKQPMWLRYVLVPGYSDQERDLLRWCEHFKDYQYVKRVEILPYHTLGVYKYHTLKKSYALEGTDPPTAQQVKRVQTIFKQYFKHVNIR